MNLILQFFCIGLNHILKIVNHYVFKLEQAIYQAEKIDWSIIEFNDNQGCLDLIEKPKTFSIVELLDEFTKLNSTPENLLRKLNDQHKKNEYYIISRYPGEFTIKHYGILRFPLLIPNRAFFLKLLKRGRLLIKLNISLKRIEIL